MSILKTKISFLLLMVASFTLDKAVQAQVGFQLQQPQTFDVIPAINSTSSINPITKKLEPGVSYTYLGKCSANQYMTNPNVIRVGLGEQGDCYRKFLGVGLVPNQNPYNIQISNDPNAQQNDNKVEEPQASEEAIIAEFCKSNEVIIANSENIDETIGKLYALKEKPHVQECIEKYAFRKIIQSQNYGESGNPVTADMTVQCRDGAFAVDFAPCMKFVNRYNLSMAAKSALDVTQQGVQMYKESEIQEKVVKERVEGNVHDAAITGIKEHAQLKQNQHQTEAAFYMGETAWIGAMLGSWVGPRNIGKACFDAFDDQKVASAACSRLDEEGIKGSVNHDAKSIFPNSYVKGYIANKLTETTGKAVANQWVSGQYKKQKNAAGEYQEKLNALKNEEDPLYQVTACDADAANCNQTGSGARVSGDVISFGDVSIGGGNGEEFAFDNADVEQSGAQVDRSKQAALEDIKQIFKDQKKNSDNSFVKAGAASLGEGGVPAAAGGGGGGGLGGAGVAGGGGGSDAASNKNKSNDIRINRGVGYGAAGAAMGYEGGKGSANNKANEEKNLFAGLFGGKDSARHTASEIDDTAGILPKKSGLFEKISSRYEWAHKNQRIQDLKK